MNPDLILSASLFALVSSITPGPNNTMILASGVNFGLRRSLRHLAGICLGFGFMLVMVGLGLHQILETYPAVLSTLRWVGGAYLLWLAYKLATAAPPHPDAAQTAHPMGFWAAAAFQWVNPKAWVMAMTAMSTYLPGNAVPLQVLLLAGLFILINVPCVTFWAAFGSSMRQLLQDRFRLRVFNVSMAIALIASLYPLLNP